ncbi:MAG: CRP-like cAMP-binding protein [Granulosicoccus sp.]|jgi:CRP-like cAMP-binding protein
MNLNDIEIFSFIDEARHESVKQLFSPVNVEKGTAILTNKEPVDGLYLLVAGEVEITIPGFDGVLATLGKGKVFGELSLFSSEDTASATVTVSTDHAELLLCPRSALTAAINEDELLAAGFYKGCSMLLAERLKSTNSKISDEIGKSTQLASALINEISSSGNLDLVTEELQSSGSNIVGGMTTILKRLLVMKEMGEPVQHQDIAALADKVKEIYYTEFQVFEKTHKQLGLLGSHLENIKRVLTQKETLEFEGDMELSDFD